MAVARDDLGRAARKRGIEGQITIIRHFGIRCIDFARFNNHAPDWLLLLATPANLETDEVML